MLDSNTGTVHGLAFFNSARNKLGCTFFKQVLKLECVLATYKQYLVMGVFTTNLEFLSCFLGHQGTSSRFLCMTCLACKTDITNACLLLNHVEKVAKRTLVLMSEDGETYIKMINKHVGSVKHKKGQT